MTAGAPHILSKLIQFDTVSHKSNLPLLDWVEARLTEAGVESRRVYDETGEKANLIATIGDASEPGYILSGHVDVVPVTGQNWTKDPFGGEISDGRVWGRGSSDMKGFAACILAALPEMTAEPLAAPLHIVLSHDEEIGCVGVRSAIADIATWEVKPKGCIVGEPTRMGVVLGHKAKRATRAVFTGRAGHSSLAPEAVNAVEYAARMATYISDIGREKQARGPFDPLLDLPHTTAHVGVLNGGEQINIVPPRAELHFEFRAIAGDDRGALTKDVIRFAREELEPAMQAVASEAKITFETLSDSPGLDTDPGAEIVTFAKTLAGRNEHSKVAFGTEGGLFDEIGIPTVVIGPGDIARAHKADEYVEIAELKECSALLAKLIKRCRV